MADIMLDVDIEGTERVVAGFQQMGGASENLSVAVVQSNVQMTRAIESSTRAMTSSYVHLGLEAARLGTNITQLFDATERFSKGQVDAAKFTLLFASNIFQTIDNVAKMAKAVKELGLVTSLLTVIEWAHNLAIAVKVGLLTLGIGLIAAAAATWWYMSQMQSLSVPTPGLPSMQSGGPVRSTGPYLLHAGEYVMPKGSSSTSLVFNIYETRSPQRTSEEVMDALRRSSVI